MDARNRKRIAIMGSIIMILGAAFCLFGAVSFAWQATSGATYGSTYVAARNEIALGYLAGACVLVLAASIAIYYGRRRKQE